MELEILKTLDEFLEDGRDDGADTRPNFDRGPISEPLMGPHQPMENRTESLANEKTPSESRRFTMHFQGSVVQVKIDDTAITWDHQHNNYYVDLLELVCVRCWWKDPITKTCLPIAQSRLFSNSPQPSPLGSPGPEQKSRKKTCNAKWKAKALSANSLVQSWSRGSSKSEILQSSVAGGYQSEGSHDATGAPEEEDNDSAVPKKSNGKKSIMPTKEKQPDNAKGSLQYSKTFGSLSKAWANRTDSQQRSKANQLPRHTTSTTLPAQPGTNQPAPIVDDLADSSTTFEHPDELQYKVVLHYIKHKRNKPEQLRVKTTELLCATELVCLEMDAVISRVLAGQSHRPRSLVVMVNPHGGKGKAVSVYNSKVAPLFKLAGLQTNMIVTTHQNHARDWLATEDLSQYDGVVAVGGDGFFNECLTGVLSRNYTHLRVAMIGAGSTNTIAWSTMGVDDPQTAALHVIIGSRTAIDVASVHAEGKLVGWCFSMASYGFFGDVVKDSESHRWMGPIRYEFAGLKTYFTARPYPATFLFHLAERPIEKTFCSDRCEVCQPTRPETAKCGMALGDEEDLNIDAIGTQPGWATVRGNYVYISGLVMSCRAPGKCAIGFSPYAHLSDGSLDLVLVRSCTPAQYLAHLLTIQNSKGDHFDFDFVETHRVTEFVMTCDRDLPLSAGGRSQWTVDGELLDPTVMLHVKVHSNLVHVFSSGPPLTNPKALVSESNSLAATALSVSKLKDDITHLAELEDTVEMLVRRTERLEATNQELLDRLEKLEQNQKND